MAETSNPMKNRMQEFGNQVGQATSAAVENMKSMAENVGSRANEFASEAAKRAAEAGDYISQRADQATAAVGDQLRSAGDASAQVSEALWDAGDHLRQEGIEGLCTDMMTLIKRNPIASMVAGLAVGFCIGRTLTMVTHSHR